MIHVIKSVFNLRSAFKGSVVVNVPQPTGGCAPEEGWRMCPKTGRGLVMFELEI